LTARLFSRIKIPRDLFPRLIPVPGPVEPGGRGPVDRQAFDAAPLIALASGEARGFHDDGSALLFI
jgi:hypothetical protein